MSTTTVTDRTVPAVAAPARARTAAPVDFPTGARTPQRGARRRRRRRLTEPPADAFDRPTRRHSVLCQDEGIDTVGKSEPAGLPVACALGAADGAERRQRWEALSATGRPVARRCGHQLVVAYQPEPGVHEELQALAAAERVCCSFVAWDVRTEAEHVVLRVTADPGSPDDVAAIAALFGAE